MFRIAICDDNITELSNLVSIINDYKALQRDPHQIQYTAFKSAVDLIAAMESGHSFELLLLDILMPVVTGMEAALEIRQFNQDIKIIFLTASPEFAVESYSVNAYYYALKPIWKDKLFILLDKVIFESQTPVGSSLLIKSKTGLTRVYIHKLEFAEVIGRTILYHLTDGSVIEAISSMSKLEKELLVNPCFIKPHRSYVINVAHINTLGQKEIKMNSLRLVPMAKVNAQLVKSAYLTYVFSEPGAYEVD